ncbi:CACTA en-spm transposon protein [Cucumis melo var. makuwa]|uniref:CACTA en-spm transposon protein n=1 Tax=Cucumis melo var. makuwa TaxID=1194695 RepID=A0A5D3CIF0_CUCMM|nr:CACTA en-spm transposon protein [Cucumis melo var. makuwa]
MQEESRTNNAARQKQPYNHSSRSKSFLQRQYELAERKRELVDLVELFRKTHVRAGMFVSQTAEDVHGSQPLSQDEICDQVLGRRLGYSKGLGWGPKLKARRTTSVSMQDRNHQALASQVETMKKMIEDFTRAQQGPPHDP